MWKSSCIHILYLNVHQIEKIIMIGFRPSRLNDSLLIPTLDLASLRSFFQDVVRRQICAMEGNILMWDTGYTMIRVDILLQVICSDLVVSTMCDRCITHGKRTFEKKTEISFWSQRRGCRIEARNWYIFSTSSFKDCQGKWVVCSNFKYSNTV